MGDLESLYAIGFEHYEQADYKKADALFTQLVLREPLEERYWHALASCKLMDQNYEEALRAWAMVSLLNGEAPLPHFHAAQCLIALEQREEAAKAISFAEKRVAGHDDPLHLKLDQLKRCL
jgi:type III secretion system low calcium response chaperone LcrH/SycD